MTLHRLVNSLYLYVAVAQLKCCIAVVLNSLLLYNDAGAGFHYCYRNNFSCLVEDLSHTDLLTDNAFLHFLFLLF